jgi:hypothetical protein
MEDHIKLWDTKWTVVKYKDPDGKLAEMSRKGLSTEELNTIFPDRFIEASVVEGNVGLNEGINELLKLIATTGAVKWDSTNAYLGVGSSSAAENPTQTGLTTVLNYVGMDGTYPQITAQTVTWKSTFGAGVGTGSWQEFTVSNTNLDTGKNLNRKVIDKGTKAAGETWTLQLDITVS